MKHRNTPNTGNIAAYFAAVFTTNERPTRTAALPLARGGKIFPTIGAANVFCRKGGF